MKYRPEIDGLRSVAVVPVILFHAGFALFSGGFVGVDVFFVISGYLITTIILQSIDAGTYSLLDFYARRSRRILPALFLVVAVTVPFAWIWMLPTLFRDFAQSVTAVSLFVSNFLFWIESDYFAPAAEAKPLLHTWSLAVEEQYYILFPLLLVLLWRRSRQLTVLVLGAILALSLGASEWGWRRAPEANFYLLPFRAWELMVGSLCAIALLDTGPRKAELPALAGLALILAATFGFDDTTPFPSLWALAPVLGTALIILFATPGTLVGRLLATRVMVMIGLISFSAYLWHQPLFAFARIAIGHPPQGVMLALSVVSLGLAWLSWRFVEVPARRPRWQPGRTVLAAAAASVALAATGLFLSETGLHRAYFLNSVAPQNRPLLAEIERMKAFNHRAGDGPGACQFVLESPDSATLHRFDACFADHGKAIAIFGDSHAGDVYNALSRVDSFPFMVLIPQDDCRPHIAGSSCDTGDLAETLARLGPRIDRAYYVQAGFWLFTDADGRKQGRNLFEPGRLLDPRLDRTAIDRVFPVLEAFDAQVPVTWIGPRIEPHVSFDTMLATDCSRTAELLALRPAHREIFEALDADLAAAAREAGIGYVSQVSATRFDIGSELFDCETLYWSDGDHWSPAGEVLFGTRLAEALRTAAPAAGE